MEYVFFRMYRFFLNFSIQFVVCEIHLCCCYICFLLFCSIVRTYLNLLFHAVVNRHLNWVQILKLWIAVRNILLDIFGGYIQSFLVGKYLGAELQCYRVYVSLALLATVNMCPPAVVPLYTLSNDFWKFSFLHILINTDSIVCLFNFSHSSWVWSHTPWCWCAFP